MTFPAFYPPRVPVRGFRARGFLGVIPGNAANPEAWFYHATPYNAVETIAEHGLQPRRGAGLFSHGGYDSHSQGRVFLAKGPTAALEWLHKVEEMAAYNAREPEEAPDVVPVLLRVDPRGVYRPVRDPLGDVDVPGSFMTERGIDAAWVSWWDFAAGGAGAWAPLARWGLHAAEEAAVGLTRNGDKAPSGRTPHSYRAREDREPGGLFYPRRGAPSAVWARTWVAPPTPPPPPPPPPQPAAPPPLRPYGSPPLTIIELGLTPEQHAEWAAVKAHYAAHPDEKAAKVAELLATPKHARLGGNALASPGDAPRTGWWWQMALQVDEHGRPETRAERIGRVGAFRRAAGLGFVGGRG